VKKNSIDQNKCLNFRQNYGKKSHEKLMQRRSKPLRLWFRERKRMMNKERERVRKKGVNFIIVKSANFSYERHFGSFSPVTCT